MSAAADLAAPPTERQLLEIEGVAVELAGLAGAQIVTGLGQILAVRYKKAPEREQAWRDPVSEVDSRVEQAIRERLAERFPEHDIVGEESDERPGRGNDFVWAIDPIDGTANYVNGFPFFSASIGVLYRGQPIVGALWCAATHALRAGVYHAHRGGRLHFDHEQLERKPRPEVRRRLAGVPRLAAEERLPWEARKTGSAAIECAFVAAGLLRVARFEAPNVWDVAGGVALVQAAGGEVRTPGPGGWQAFETFELEEDGAEPDVRHWRQPLIVGESEAVAEWLRLDAASRA